MSRYLVKIRGLDTYKRLKYRSLRNRIFIKDENILSNATCRPTSLVFPWKRHKKNYMLHIFMYLFNDIRSCVSKLSLTSLCRHRSSYVERRAPRDDRIRMESIKAKPLRCIKVYRGIRLQWLHYNKKETFWILIFNKITCKPFGTSEITYLLIIVLYVR